MADLIERLRDAAADAAAEEYGVSGLLTEAAAELRRLHEQLRLATLDQAIAEAEASDAHAENKRLQESLAALEQEAGRG